MIVINARFLTQHVTGIQRFASEITGELLALRSDVVLAAPRGPLSREGPDDRRIVRVGRLSGHAWEQIELPLFARRRGAVLLDLTSTGPIWYAPQVSTHHDITWLRHPESFDRRFRAVYRFVVPRLIARSDRLLTVSDFSKAEIATRFDAPAEKFTVVPNAADARFRPDGETAPGRYLLAVSSPNAHKNFARMLAAFTRFSATHPDVELRVAGNQTHAFSRQEYAVPGERVRFLGRIGDDELTTLYRGALAFVFPSLYEGFGIPPLEAQQSGCPVIAARAAALPEVLGDSALFIDPYDIDDIANAMTRVVDDAALRTRLSRDGLRNARRYSWRASAARVSRVLDDVVAARGRPSTLFDGSYGVRQGRAS